MSRTDSLKKLLNSLSVEELDHLQQIALTIRNGGQNDPYLDSATFAFTGLLLRELSNQGAPTDEQPSRLYIAVLAIAMYKQIADEAGAKSGQTALHRAAAANNDFAIDLLRRAGANPEHRDLTDKTPQDYVSEPKARSALFDPIKICRNNPFCKTDCDPDASRPSMGAGRK